MERKLPAVLRPNSKTEKVWLFIVVFMSMVKLEN